MTSPVEKALGGIQRQATGSALEERAVRELTRAGYKVIGRNFRTKLGEVDIIATERDYVCFVEVRFRKNTGRGTAAESVTRGKQVKVIRAAQAWLLKHPAAARTLQPRFDVVAIDADEQGRETIQILKGAFMADR